MSSTREDIEFTAVSTNSPGSDKLEGATRSYRRSISTGSNSNKHFSSTSMPSKSSSCYCIVGLVIVAVLLIVILVPLSLKGLDYYEYGFKRRSTTGSVDLSHTYSGGRHHIGVDYNFKIFPADAHFLEFKRISVFAADRLEVSISADCQYFLRPKQLPELHRQYDVKYKDVLKRNVMDAIKGAATRFTTRQFIHERMNVEEAIFTHVKRQIGGDCCDEYCLKDDSCLPNCIPQESCPLDSSGLFAEVRYFQLLDLSIPSTLSERYTQALVLQEAEEKEQYLQEAQLVRKNTERLVAEIENEASIINENATAMSVLIRSNANANATSIVEGARMRGLETLYNSLGIRDAGHKATFDYLRTVKNMANARLAVNFDSLWAGSMVGSSRRRRSARALTQK